MDITIVGLIAALIFFSGAAVPIYLLGKVAGRMAQGGGCLLRGLLWLTTLPILVCSGLLVWYLLAHAQ